MPPSPSLLLALLLSVASVAALEAPHLDHRHALSFFPVSRARRLLAVGASLNTNASGPLPSSGAWVAVSWSLPASIVPSPHDAVAYYSPSTVNITATAPVKFINATGLATGSLSFWLYNQRADGIFFYFSGGLASPVAVAQSPAVSFSNLNAPASVHLALTGVAGQLRVGWNSLNSTTLAGGPPAVRWGSFNIAAALLSSAAASTSTYAASDLCPTDPLRGAAASDAGGVGWRDPGQLHTAVMTGLQPSSTVYYQVGSPAGGWSQVFSAVAPPAAGAPVRAAVVADMGCAELDGSNTEHGLGSLSRPEVRSYFSMQPSLANAAALAAEVAGGASLVLHNGDLSYAMGYGAMWDTYGAQTQPAASAAPWMVAHGNHESNWRAVGRAPQNPHSGLFNSTNRDSGGECSVATAARYPMPGAPAPDAPWHSYDHGAVHWVTMSTEHPYWPGTPQFDFLQADLRAAAARRDAAAAAGAGATAPRWIVFSGHRPFYISSPFNGKIGVAAAQDPSDGPAAMAMQAALEPLWQQYGVDVTLVGHHHSYQRTHPVAYATVVSPCANGDQAGTVHFVLGNGGAGFSTAVCANPAAGGAPATGWAFCPMGPFFAVVTGDGAATANHGYARIDADGTTLNVTAFATDVVAGGVVVMDRVNLTKALGVRSCVTSPPPAFVPFNDSLLAYAPKPAVPGASAARPPPPPPPGPPPSLAPAPAPAPAAAPPPPAAARPPRAAKAAPPPTSSSPPPASSPPPSVAAAPPPAAAAGPAKAGGGTVFSAIAVLAALAAFAGAVWWYLNKNSATAASDGATPKPAELEDLVPRAPPPPPPKT